MNRNYAVILLIAGLITAPAIGAAQSSGQGGLSDSVRGSPDLSVTVTDDTVVPGESRQLTLSLSNSGNLDVGSSSNPALNSEVTTARALKIDLERNGAPVTVNTGTQSLGSLPQGQSAQLPYQISVKEDAKPGTYTMEAEVTYTYTSYIAESVGEYSTTTRTKTFDVDVTVDDRARFEIVDTETDVRVGSAGTIDVTMENVGSEAASDTTVTLASRNTDITFGQSAEASRYAGEWESGETRTISYQASAAPTAEQQQYAFTATAEFEDSDGTPRTSQPLSLGVTPLAEQRFSVVDTESTVSVGDTGSLTLTMENTGAITVNDATVDLQSTSSAIVFGDSASTSGFVGEWAPGEQKSVTVDVTATDAAETRSYALRATVNYDDEDDDAGQSSPISLGLTPEPETGFALSNVSNTLRVGEEGVIRGTITNNGQTAVRDAVLQFTTENANVNPSEREYSVGNLEPGESTDFQFTVEISQGAEAGPRQFSFVTEYRNQDGETRTSDELLTRQDVGEQLDAFAVEVREGSVQNGGSTTLQVEVTNQLNETVSSVSAKMFTDDPISASDSEAFVDELGPGETTTINFTVGASGASPKVYPVSLDFQYDDADGDTLVSDTYRLPVEVTDRERGGGGLPLGLLGVGALIVIGVGAFIRFRD
jgi:hypothetical protein